MASGEREFITSRADPRLAEVVAAEYSDRLPLGARRGYPGVVNGDGPAFDGRVKNANPSNGSSVRRG